MAFTVLSFIQIMYGQDCNNVTVEAFPMIPQSGLNSYFGVRVSLTQPYYQNVTVSGYIWDGPDEHGFNTDHPYTLTIAAGSLSAETAVNFYQTGPAAEGAANITSVSPCPSAEINTELTQLFKNLDPSILQSQDSAAVENYLAPKTPDIVNYVQATYGEDLNQICEGNQTWIFLAGFIVAINEAYGENGSNGYNNYITKIKKPMSSWANNSLAAVATLSRSNPQFRLKWVSCAEAALGIGAIASLIDDYGALLSGSVRTALGVFKNIAKRY